MVTTRYRSLHLLGRMGRFFLSTMHHALGVGQARGQGNRTSVRRFPEDGGGDPRDAFGGFWILGVRFMSHLMDWSGAGILCTP